MSIEDMKKRHIENVQTALLANGLKLNEIAAAFQALSADANSAWARSIALLGAVARGEK